MAEARGGKSSFPRVHARSVHEYSAYSFVSCIMMHSKGIFNKAWCFANHMHILGISIHACITVQSYAEIV